MRSIRFADRNVEFLSVKRATVLTERQYALPYPTRIYIWPSSSSKRQKTGFAAKTCTNVQHRIIRKIYKSNYSNIIRYYSTGIIVKNMVLLLNYRVRGAPSLGPTPRDGPLPHSPGLPASGSPRPRATCLRPGPKSAPYDSISPKFTGTIK